MTRIALALAIACLACTVPLVAAQAKPTGESSRAATKPASSSTALVNINSATAAEFEALPGIGPKMAARIIEYRQKNGPFKKVEELMNVRGLGEKNFLKLKGQLTLGSTKTGDRPDR